MTICLIRQQLSEALLNSLEFLSDLRREQWRRSIVRGNERAYTGLHKGSCDQTQHCYRSESEMNASSLQTRPSKVWTMPDHDKFTDLVLEMAAERL